MPLFSLISGYFAAKSFEKYKLRTIPRYLRRLGLPCISMGILANSILFVENNRSFNEVIHAFGSLWYLVVTLECFLLFVIAI